jgi:NADH dehydrogenase
MISAPSIPRAHTFTSSKAARTCSPPIPRICREALLEQLQRLGVEVLTSTMVTGIEPGVIYMGDRRMNASVILWAAGVAASPLGKKLGAPVDRAGRVQVHPDLSLPGHPEVFVIGDLAALKDASGKLLPGVAPVAILEGRYVGKLIKHEIAVAGTSAKTAPRKPFHYYDKGSLATIGRAAAMAEFGKVHISGFIAWLAWLFIHIWFLIGFRNRVLVFIQWAWSYATYERGARLITGSTNPPGLDPSPSGNLPAGKIEEETTAASHK